MDSESEAASLAEVEEVFNYRFKNKTHLLEALTHPSYTNSPTNYDRLELLGEGAVRVIVTQVHFYKFDGHDVYLLIAANLSTEKLARVAVRHGLFKHVRHCDPSLDVEVRDFAMAIQEEGNGTRLPFSQSVKAPKVLADIVESITGAIIVDSKESNVSLNVPDHISRLLEPYITMETIGQLPVFMLYELCQEQSMQVDIKVSRNVTQSIVFFWLKTYNTIASVYVDGDLLCSCWSNQEEKAKTDAAKKAWFMLREDNSNLEFDVEDSDEDSGEE